MSHGGGYPITRRSLLKSAGALTIATLGRPGVANARPAKPIREFFLDLNRIHKWDQGWELLQRNVAQSGLITYIMKRRRTADITP